MLVAVNALLATLLACNLPAGPGGGQPPDLAGTITARAAVPMQSSNTPNFTATVLIAVDSPLTPTPSVPQVSITTATDCRAGPGFLYDVLYTLPSGQTAVILGKDTLDNYWIIQVPGKNTCWLSGQNATVSGNVAALPKVSPPPAPTPALPADPSGLRAAYSCKKSLSPFPHNDVHVSLSWQDNAANEEGYYVFRDGTLLATLAAGATSFTDDTTMAAVILPGDSAPHITYAIQAFSTSGTSAKISKSISCLD